MCKTKGTPPGFNVYSRRRSKYTLEEKKGIAKTKAKKRRDEETKYFTEIDAYLRNSCSPYIGLPDKLIHNASLRLTNAWKISYYVLFRLKTEALDAQPKRSLVQEISSDLILLTTHRFCEVRDASSAQAFTFLYASPTVQNYIHVSGCHDVIGAKFDDFCMREELEGAYLELRAPMTQKDKRPYPAVRCRVMRSELNQKHKDFQLGFFLLRAPLPHRSGTKSSCAAILKRHLNSGASGQDSFESHGPQYWRAMQSRRRAILRGASRDLVVPEQLISSHKSSRKTPKAEPPQICDPPTISFLAQLNEAEPPPFQSLPSESNQVFCENRNVRGNSSNFGCNRTSLVCNNETIECSGAKDEGNSASVGCTSANTGCNTANIGYNGTNIGFNNPNLACNGANLACNCSTIPCNSTSFACNSANSSPYHSNSLSLSPILSADDLLTNFSPEDIDAALQSLEQQDSPDVVCLDSLNTIMPTIGLETPNLPVEASEIESLKLIAATGDPSDICPCGLTTKAECLEILDTLSLKTEPTECPVKEEFEEDPIVPKLENFEEEAGVTFTADYEEDDLSRIRGFLASEQGFCAPLPPDTKPFSSSSSCGLQRSSASFFMDTQTSEDPALFAELATSCCAPRYIGDRQQSFEPMPEGSEDSISALLDTPMHNPSEASMTEISEMMGITKKLSETSMDD